MLNFTMLAKGKDYLKQAYVAATSIKLTNPGSKVCIITNDDVPENYQKVFDYVVEIPWATEETSLYATEDRWKIYHATPFDRTIVLDTDMLVLEDISHWWDFLQKRKLFWTSNVLTYRSTKLTSNYYRKAFRQHDLPDLYSGFHYFEKSEEAHLFYKWLELVSNNWELFYGQFAGGKYFQKHPSFDVTAAIVTKILSYEDIVMSKNTSFPNFVHMKPHAQNWWGVKEKWQDKVGVYLDNNCKLKIGNFKQNGIFHYTEKDFLTDEILQKYERCLESE